jgi:hypothetical protein
MLTKIGVKMKFGEVSKIFNGKNNRAKKQTTNAKRE